MVEAVAVVLPFQTAALGRRVETGLVAALPLAFRARVAQQTVLVRLDAQAVDPCPEFPSMTVENSIREKLTRAFAPVSLDVVNESDHHAGHAGSPGTGESHFRVKVVSEAFAGKSRLERHRMVNAVLAEELSGKIHALAVTALTPEDDARRL
jgi:stress-induced morphogen